MENRPELPGWYVNTILSRVRNSCRLSLAVLGPCRWYLISKHGGLATAYFNLAVPLSTPWICAWPRLWKIKLEEAWELWALFNWAVSLLPVQQCSLRVVHLTKLIKKDKRDKEGRIPKRLVERRWSWGRRRIGEWGKWRGDGSWCIEEDAPESSQEILLVISTKL